MRRPQTGFEAQPRIARLLAPKMGIGPYRKWLYHVAQITCPFFNCSWSLSAMSAINSVSEDRYLILYLNNPQ